MTFQDNKQLAAFLMAHAIADHNIEQHNYWHEFRQLALRECKTLGITLPQFIKLAFGLESSDITWIAPARLVKAMVKEIQDIEQENVIDPNFEDGDGYDWDYIGRSHENYIPPIADLPASSK